MKTLPGRSYPIGLRAGKSLSRAISAGTVPIQHVLTNVTDYLTLAYSDNRRALKRIGDDETSQLLLHGLRTIQITRGQTDTLTLAVERKQ